MKSSQKTILPLVVGLAIMVVLKLVGLAWAASIIIGAIVSIVLAFLMNRRENQAAEGEGSVTSQADLSAMLASASSSVDGFVTATDEIANPSTKEIAGKIGTNMQGIVTELQKPENSAAVPVVVDNLIEPAQSLLTEYLFLTKKAIASTTPRSKTIEQSTFPAIESASRQTLSLLQEPGTPDITKITRASTVPFEQTVTIPPGGTTAKGSREIKPG